MADGDSSSSVGIVAILAIMILVGLVTYFFVLPRAGGTGDGDLDVDVDLNVPEVNMDVRIPGAPGGFADASELGFFIAA
jgi:hypothetical protein